MDEETRIFMEKTLTNCEDIASMKKDIAYIKDLSIETEKHTKVMNHELGETRDTQKEILKMLDRFPFNFKFTPSNVIKGITVTSTILGIIASLMKLHEMGLI